MDSELHATDAIVPLALDFGSWTWCHWSLQCCQCDESIALCEVATGVKVNTDKRPFCSSGIGVPLQWPGLELGSGHVAFVVDKVALEQVFS
jgi:hypothetical protein